MEKKKWLDWSAYGAEGVIFRKLGNSSLYVVVGLEEESEAYKKLLGIRRADGRPFFTPSGSRLWCASHLVPVDLIVQAFPDLTLTTENPRPLLFTQDNAPEEEGSFVSAYLSDATPVGTNYHGDTVLVSPIIRAVKRVDKNENVHFIYEDEVDDPAAFLRQPIASTNKKLFVQFCAKGLVKSIEAGKVLKTADISTYLSVMYERSFPESTLENDPLVAEFLDAVEQEITQRTFDLPIASEREFDQAYRQSVYFYERTPSLFAEGLWKSQRKTAPLPAPLLVALKDAFRLKGEFNCAFYSAETHGLAHLIPKNGISTIFNKANSRIEQIREITGNSDHVKIYKDSGHTVRFSGVRPDFTLFEDSYRAVANPLKVDDFVSSRIDFLHAVSALRERTDNGLSVLALPSSDSIASYKDPLIRTIKNTKSSDLLNYLGRRYDIVATAELHHSLFQKSGPTFSTRIVVVGNRKPELAGSFSARKDIPVYDKEALRSWEELSQWSSKLKAVLTAQELLVKQEKQKRAPSSRVSAYQNSLDLGFASSDEEPKESRRQSRFERKSKIEQVTSTSATQPNEVVLPDNVLPIREQGSPALEFLAESLGGDNADVEARADVTFEEEDPDLDTKKFINPFSERREKRALEADQVSYEDLGLSEELDETLLAYVDQFVFERRYDLVTEEDENILDKGRKNSKVETSYQAPTTLITNLKEPTSMVPRNLVGPMSRAGDRLIRAVGDVDRYVSNKLRLTYSEISEVFSGEQIQTLALALYRMEQGKGFIIGSQTGTGKGRAIAAIARFCKLNNKPFMFVTEGSHLFSDFYRDLKDIKADQLFTNVLIINNDSKANIYDDISGELIFKRNSLDAQAIIEKTGSIESSLIENRIDLCLATYSQFRGKSSKKAEWIREQALLGSMIVLDESHNAAGASSTAKVFQEALEKAEAALHSSATFAKTPDAMSTYSTVFPPGMEIEEIKEVLRKGGDAMSEIVSSMLAEDGAFIRFEHDFSKLKFIAKLDYTNLERNTELADKLADILREINRGNGSMGKMAQKVNQRYMSQTALDDELLLPHHRSTQVESLGFGSEMYNIQRIFALLLKADYVADAAIEALRNGQKPVIVLEQTQESLLAQSMKAFLNAKAQGYIDEQHVYDEITVDEDGNELPELIEGEVDLERGVRIPMVSMRHILLKAFRKATTVKRRDANGEVQTLSVLDLARDEAYLTAPQIQIIANWMTSVEEMIHEFPEIPLTAIDYVRAKIEKAGYSFGEVTGRKYYADIEGEEGSQNLLVKRRPDTRQEDVRNFNNGTLDSILVNIAGASGISLHANRKFANTNQRVLIEWQIPNDVNKRIQLLGRINRVGQVCDPEIWTVSTGLPFETRINSMQLAKLRALSANTQGSRRNIVEESATIDLMNKVGNECAKEFLLSNPDVCDLLAIDMEVLSRQSSNIAYINKLSFLISLLYVEEQVNVFEKLETEFKSRIRDLELYGENPLKAAEYDWKARTISETIFEGIEQDFYESAFDSPVYARTVEFDEILRPIQWSYVQTEIESAQARWTTHFNDERFQHTRVYDLMSKAEEEMKDIMRAHVPTRYLPADKDPDSIEARDEAIAQCLQSNGGGYMVFMYNERINWMKENMPNIYPGARVQFQSNWSTFIPTNALVLDLQPPRPGDESKLNEYKIKLAVPGETVPRQVSMSQLYDRDLKVVPVEFLVNDLITQTDEEAFASAPSGVITTRRTVLTGNLFKAISTATHHKLGGVPGVYTDENNVRHNAIMLNKTVANRTLAALPVKVTLDAATHLIRRIPGISITLKSCATEDLLSIKRSFLNDTPRLRVSFEANKKRGNWMANEPLISTLRSERNFNHYTRGKILVKEAMLNYNKLDDIIKHLEDTEAEVTVEGASRAEINIELSRLANGEADSIATLEAGPNRRSGSGPMASVA